MGVTRVRHDLATKPPPSHIKVNFEVAQMVKNLPTMRETWIRFLGQEDSLEKGMATHCSILAWRIPWTEITILVDMTEGLMLFLCTHTHTYTQIFSFSLGMLKGFALSA